MRTATLPDSHSDRAGEQADRATEDMQDQQRETHVFHFLSAVAIAVRL